MANFFLDPGTGSDADNGTTMDLAFATAAYALIGNRLAGGDTLWIRRTLAETLAATLTAAFTGQTTTNPVKVIGWPRAALNVLSSDWVNGSTSVVINDGGMTTARHCGRYILGPDNRTYRIEFVTDASHVVLTKEYVGPNASGQIAVISADEDYGAAQAINDSAWTIKKADWNADPDDLPLVTGTSAYRVAWSGESNVYIANLRGAEGVAGVATTSGTWYLGNNTILQGCMVSGSQNGYLIGISASVNIHLHRTSLVGSSAGTSQHGIGLGAGQAGWGGVHVEDSSIYNLGGSGMSISTGGVVQAWNTNIGVAQANDGADILVASGQFLGRDVKLGSTTPVSITGSSMSSFVSIENYQRSLGSNKTWHALGSRFSVAAGVGTPVPNQRSGGSATLLEVAHHVSSGSGTFDESQMIVLAVHEFDAPAVAKNYRYYIQTVDAIVSGDLVLQVEYVSGYGDAATEYNLVKSLVTGAIAARANINDWSQYLETGNITPIAGTKVRLTLKTDYYHATATYDFWIDPQCRDDVAPGWSFGESISSMPAVPAVGDVQSAVTFNGGFLTGTFGVPAVGDVQAAVQYGAAGTEFTGTFGVPTESQVLLAVGFGAGGTEFTGNVTLPAVGDVELGVTFGAGLALTGTFAAPTESQVLLDVGFGAGGAEFTGNVTLPAVGDVELGVTFGAGLALTGTFAAPLEADVKLDIQYGAGGVEFTGVYTVSADYPSEDDVRDGVTFDTGLQEGNLVLPAEAVVKVGTGYGSNGTELLGAMATQTIGPSIIRGTGGGGRIVGRA